MYLVDDATTFFDEDQMEASSNYLAETKLCYISFMVQVLLV
jgi:hypothetical protein